MCYVSKQNEALESIEYQSDHGHATVQVRHAAQLQHVEKQLMAAADELKAIKEGGDRVDKELRLQDAAHGVHYSGQLPPIISTNDADYAQMR